MPGFDPYSKWLGIPPEDQPPHHYRLLGLKPFLDDPEAVKTAADRRMDRVRQFAVGPRADLSQKILNELLAARVCLADPQKKASYDRKLKAVLSAPTAPPPEALTSTASGPNDSGPHRRLPLLGVVAVAGAVCLIGIVAAVV